MLSISEAVIVTLTSIMMVFLVLIGLMLVTMAFKYIFKEESPHKAQAVQPSPPKIGTTNLLPANKDPKMIAALTALVVANEDTNKQYTVTSVERIE